MKAKPDHDLILSTYHQEVARGGKPGALARAATRLGVSDETVRRARLADERAPIEQELVYTPAPGERPIAPRVVPQTCHKPRHTSPLMHHKRRLRVVAPLATRHIVSEDVAPHIAAGDLLYAPRVTMSSAYEARLRSVNRFATPAPVHVQDLTYHEPFNLRLWGIVALTVFFCIVLFATTHYHVAGPLKGSFAPSVSVRMR